MRHFGLGHVLMAVAFLIVPGAAIAFYTAQPTTSGYSPSDDLLPFGLGHRGPEHGASGPLVETDWAEDADADRDRSDSPDKPRGGGSDSTAPIVDALSASGIPEVALHAYARGQETMDRDDPRCNLRWSLLAAIGRVETNHGRYGGAQLREDGSGTKPIRGIALDGRPGVALIRDTDNGRLDDDTTYDRAVGPLQFIPSTWKSVAADGNGDGDQDPDNIFDATIAASIYLCSGNTNLDEDDQLSGAVFRYNHSQEYVDLVLSLAEAYENGLAPDLPDAGPTETPTEPLPEPVPDPANEGEPPGLSELSGSGQVRSPSTSVTATTSTVPRRPPSPTTAAPPTAPRSTTTTPPTPPPTTPTPSTTVPPDPDDPVEPECLDPEDPDPEDPASDGAEPAEPVDPECCASDPDDVDASTEPETTTTSAPPNDAEADDALPPECCTDDAEPEDRPDGTGTGTDPEADDALPPECCTGSDDPSDPPGGTDPDSGIADDPVCRKEEPDE